MFTKLRAQYFNFPQTFRILVIATFIDRLGGALIFPFLSLYVAQRFEVGMTEVGLLFGTWSISSLVGSMIGGALTDKFGRKKILIFGLIFSAFTSLTLGLIDELKLFYFLAAFSAIFADIGHPASQAMVADLLGENKRTEGFSIMRVVANLAITFGPMIGGLLSGISFFLLFVLDTVATSITTIIVIFKIPETKPDSTVNEKPESFMETVRGYKIVAKDRLFVAFVFSSLLMLIVYTQMYSTLSVFLLRVHDISAQEFGFMMSMNAAMVVLLQYWITRRVKNFSPMVLLVAANIIYGFGFGMFAFVNQIVFFFIAMAVITIGEMIHIPSSQALATSFAPETMRGRYMAAFGLSWALPNTFAPLLAGMVMDNFSPQWVWILAIIISTLSASSFFYLHIRTRNRFKSTLKGSPKKTNV